MKTQNPNSSATEIFLLPTTEELLDALKDIDGETLYENEQEIVSMPPLLQHTVVALQQMQMRKITSHWKTLIHNDLLQQAIIDLSQIGLQFIQSKLNYIIKNKDIFPAITAFKAMGETELEKKWDKFKQKAVYTSVAILHDIGVTSIEDTWSQVSRYTNYDLHTLIKKLGERKEKITQELWEKIVSHKELQNALLIPRLMQANHLEDKIEQFLKPEHKNLVEVIQALNAMGANDIDSKWDAIIANPDLQTLICDLKAMKATNIDHKWPILLESKNQVLLESIHALKAMKVEKIDAMWDILTTYELVPEAVLALKEMGQTDITFSSMGIFSKDLEKINTACEVLIWLNKIGIKPTGKDWAHFAIINKSCLLALRDMNIENFHLKWKALPKNYPLEDCIIMLRKAGLENIEPLWEALTTRKDLLYAIPVLIEWGILNVQEQWKFLTTNENLTQTILILKRWDIPNPSKDLWDALKNSYFQDLILAMDQKIKDKPISFYLPIFQEHSFQKAFHALIAMDAENLPQKVKIIKGIYLSNAHSFEKVKPLLDAISAIKNMGGETIEDKWVSLERYPCFQNAIIALDEIGAKDIETKWEVLLPQLNLWKSIIALKESKAKGTITPTEALEQVNSLFNPPNTNEKNIPIKLAVDPSTMPLKPTPSSKSTILSTSLFQKKKEKRNSKDTSFQFNLESLFEEGIVEKSTSKENLTQGNPVKEVTEVKLNDEENKLTKGFTLTPSKIISEPEAKPESPIKLRATKLKTSEKKPTPPPFTANKQPLSSASSEVKDVLSSNRKLSPSIPNISTKEKINSGKISKPSAPQAPIEDKLTNPVSPNKDLSKKPRKKSSQASFYLNALSFFAGCGGALSIVASLATYTLPPLLVGISLLGAFFFLEHLNKPSNKKTEIIARSEKLKIPF